MKKTVWAISLILFSSLCWASPPPDSAYKVMQTSLGEFTVSEHWAVSEEGETGLEGQVSFLPNKDVFPSCSSLKLIQVAQWMSNGKIYYFDNYWLAGQSNRNLIETQADPSRGVEAGWFVDHDASVCQKGKTCSPYFSDFKYFSGPGTHGGSVEKGVQATSASLTDVPYGHSAALWEQIHFETCVACADSEQPKLYQCVRWGGYWPAMDRGEQRHVVRETEPQAPSPTFLEALSNFMRFYSPGT